MIIILHNSDVEASRNFVASYGEGYEVIDFSNEPEKVSSYRYSGNPPVSAFPSVVDTEKRIIVREPASMQVALDVFNPVLSFEEKKQLKLTALETAVNDYIDAKFNSITRDYFVDILLAGPTQARLDMILANKSWMASVQQSYYTRRQSAANATTEEELNLISIDFSSFDESCPNYQISDIEAAQ